MIVCGCHTRRYPGTDLILKPLDVDASFAALPLANSDVATVGMKLTAVGFTSDTEGKRTCGKCCFYQFTPAFVTALRFAHVCVDGGLSGCFLRECPLSTTLVLFDPSSPARAKASDLTVVPATRDRWLFADPEVINTTTIALSGTGCVILVRTPLRLTVAALLH